MDTVNDSRPYQISEEAFLYSVKQWEETHVIEILESFQLHDMLSHKYPLVRLKSANGNTPLL